MSDWAEANGKLTELQNGFHRNRPLENNLFVLTQCIEVTRKEALESRGVLYGRSQGIRQCATRTDAPVHGRNRYATAMDTPLVPPLCQQHCGRMFWQRVLLASDSAQRAQTGQSNVSTPA